MCVCVTWSKSTNYYWFSSVRGNTAAKDRSDRYVEGRRCGWRAGRGWLTCDDVVGGASDQLTGHPPIAVFGGCWVGLSIRLTSRPPPRSQPLVFVLIAARCSCCRKFLHFRSCALFLINITISLTFDGWLWCVGVCERVIFDSLFVCSSRLGPSMENWWSKLRGILSLF